MQRYDDVIESGSRKALLAQLSKIRGNIFAKLEEFIDESSTVTSRRTNKIFVSYSHKDSRWLARIQTALKPLSRKLVTWADDQIPPGANWAEAIREALQ